LQLDEGRVTLFTVDLFSSPKEGAAPRYSKLILDEVPQPIADYAFLENALANSKM